MDNKKFGNFIAALRKEKGWTQRDLAKQLHVTDKAVSKWERGLGFPDIKTIEPLADALEVSILFDHGYLAAAHQLEKTSKETNVCAHTDMGDTRDLVSICGDGVPLCGIFVRAWSDSKLVFVKKGGAFASPPN